MVRGGLGEDQVCTYVIDHLVRGAAVVLEEVVVFGAGGAGEPLADGLEMNSLVSVLVGCCVVWWGAAKW